MINEPNENPDGIGVLLERCPFRRVQNAHTHDTIFCLQHRWSNEELHASHGAVLGFCPINNSNVFNEHSFPIKGGDEPCMETYCDSIPSNTSNA